MKIKALAIALLFGVISLSGCTKEGDCSTCTYGDEVLEVCKLPNGNASADGHDTGQPYRQYKASIEVGGWDCP